MNVTTQDLGMVGVGQAAATLAHGFADDPLLQWIFPDPGSHFDYSVRYFTHQAIAAAEHGSLLTAANNAGAAVWLTSDQWRKLEADPAHEARLRAACGPHAQRAVMYDHATTDRHPVDRPHWYLGYIGVVPVYRSHGVGSALLRHVLEVCDKQALGSYLEASSERSAKLYGRHGFQQTGPAIQLPDGGPKMLPMWREPERTEPKGPLPRENSRRRRAVVAFRLRRRLALAAPASQEEVLQDGTDVLFRCRTTMPPDAYAPG